MEMGAGHKTRLAEGLPTRWRPLYDHYGPVRPGLLRCSAVPSPEPPTTPAIVRLRLQGGHPAAKLLMGRPAGVSALTANSSFRWKHDSNEPTPFR